MRISGNDYCPCGSQKKHKRCCMPGPMGVSASDLRKLEAAAEWRRRYGDVRPIISCDFQGQKAVAIGNQLLIGKFPIFGDFLIAYTKHILGAWLTEELGKQPEDQHPIAQWFLAVKNYNTESRTRLGGAINGGTASFATLAYDLYTVQHNQELQSHLLKRLMDSREFQGARYELFAAATCIRAGFEIDFMPNRGSEKKFEFKAVHKVSRETVWVEAKSKQRQGVLGFEDATAKPPDDLTKSGIKRLLEKALKKPPLGPAVIFLELNLPPTALNDGEQLPWFDDVMKICESVISRFDRDGAPFNMLIFSNFASHYDLYGAAMADPLRFAWPKNPRFALPLSELTLGKLCEAANLFGVIPKDFPPEDHSPLLLTRTAPTIGKPL